MNLEPLAKPVKSEILVEPVATIVEPTPCADFASWLTPSIDKVPDAAEVAVAVTNELFVDVTPFL